MFFHLLYIHLFRPFLKYNPQNSPLPTHVSPRKLCTQAASLISKLMRLYKRTYGLRQICNIAVYMVHSACTIHLLNMPEKTAKRDIVHGVKHLEEIAEDWLCARRTLSILSVLARKWNIELPEDASAVLARTDAKYGTFSTADVPSPKAEIISTPPANAPSPPRLLQVQSPPRPGTQPQYYMSNQSLASVPPSPANQSVGIGMLSDGQTSSIGLQARIQNGISPIPPPRTTGTIALPSESSMQIVNPYSQQVHYYMPGSRQSHLSNASTTSGTAPSSLTRQVSPSVMFGGVESLVESQDWWLRDQASLAVGFDNWGSLDNSDASIGQSSLLQSRRVNGNSNGNGNSHGNGNGNGGGFFMNGNENSMNNGYGEDEWYS
jgi:hypothetical protein